MTNAKKFNTNLIRLCVYPKLGAGSGVLLSLCYPIDHGLCVGGKSSFDDRLDKDWAACFVLKIGTSKRLQISSTLQR